MVRSARRRRTVEAREVDGVIRVSIPATMSVAEERRHVERMVARLQRRRAASSAPSLEERAAELSARLGLPRPASIRWVDNQTSRWGSCTPADGSVRISSRLATYPRWVLDYVVVHELAHLVVPRHDQAFWALVGRYERAERARGFLMAMSREGDREPEEADPGGWGCTGGPEGVASA